MDLVSENCNALLAHINELQRELREARNRINELESRYALFEEMAPPDIPRKMFVEMCFDAFHNREEHIKKSKNIKFRYKGGFKDGTDYIEWDVYSNKMFLVMKNGNRKETIAYNINYFMSRTIEKEWELVE
jgi:predicted nuclease with TOPRIM domain